MVEMSSNDKLSVEESLLLLRIVSNLGPIFANVERQLLNGGITRQEYEATRTQLLTMAAMCRRMGKSNEK